jgi:hypothetical protein
MRIIVAVEKGINITYLCVRGRAGVRACSRARVHARMCM